MHKLMFDLNLRLKHLCQDYKNDLKTGIEHLEAIGPNIMSTKIINLK